MDSPSRKKGQALQREGAYFEHISIPPDRSFLWRMDDYPWRRCVWNYHPEFEIHLIRYSSGLTYVGDHIGGFHGGQLVLVGSNLPHNWVTPSIGDEKLPDRDVVVQFDPERIRSLAADLPETAELEGLFERAAFGIEFSGDTAVEGGCILEAIGQQKGLHALVSLLQLLTNLARSTEYRKLASQEFLNQFRPGTATEREKLDLAMDFIQRTFRNQISIAEVARSVDMSESAFSRFFKAQTGNTYSDHICSLRIWTARKLLSESDIPITDICYEAGFNNISNFNRTFLRITGLTPSRYRQASGERGT